MRISDWSSDVCSSDLLVGAHRNGVAVHLDMALCDDHLAVAVVVKIVGGKADLVLGRRPGRVGGQRWNNGGLKVGLAGRNRIVRQRRDGRRARDLPLGGILRRGREIGRATWRARGGQYV